MTITKEFIKTNLRRLAMMFPNIEINYSFNNLADAHIVQLTPQVEYCNNAALDDAWFDIAGQFIENFPDENICFVSDDAKLINCIPEFVFNVVATSPMALEFSGFNGLDALSGYAPDYLVEFKVVNTEQLVSNFEGEETKSEINFDGDVNSAGEYSYIMAA